jgi:hypothetical protein
VLVVSVVLAIISLASAKRRHGVAFFGSVSSCVVVIGEAVRWQGA